MAYVFLFFLGWLVVCLPALIYAGVIERRRRRDAAATEEKFKQLVKNVEFLEQRLRSAQFAAPPQTATAPQPDVHILPQAAAPPPPAATHPAPPAYAPLVAPKPAPPVTPPQPAPTSTQVQATCAKCGAALAPAAHFCIRCGAVVEVSKPPSPPAAAQPHAAETVPSVTPPAPKPAPPPPPPQIAKPPAVTAPPPVHATGSSAPGTPQRPPLPAPSSAPPAHASAVQAPIAPRVAQPAPKKPSRSFEEVVGTNWLPKLGVALVVVALAFLAANNREYVALWWHWIGPYGRDALVLLAGMGLLFGGIKFESRATYKALGRSMIGGGWALLFLLAYAIRHSSPSTFQILASDWVDLAVLLVVTAFMVGHTLRYNSQTVTGLAFLLGFTAVTLNPDPPANMIAGAFLVAGMTRIVVRRRWFPLEVVGILASYGNHFYWLYQVYEEQGQRAMFPHHTWSVALVIGYWVVFRASYLFRKVADKQQEAVSTFAGLLNPLLFLIVMKYQGFHPEWAWGALLVMGVVEFVLGQLPVARQRRAPFQILSSLGATLMVAAPAVRGSGNALEIIWLIGAEAFLVAGILPFTRERLFRGFGLIISFLVALYALPVRMAPLAQQVLAGQPHHDGQVSLILAVIALALYANAHVTRRFWPDLFENEPESFALTALSFGASLFAVAAIYAYVPDRAIAVVLALLVTLLSVTGKLFSFTEMIYEAHWIAVVAFVQVLVADRALETPWLGVPQRVWAFGTVAALLYLSSRFVRLSETRGNALFSGAYAWAGTSLLTLLLWFQMKDWAAVGWIALGLALSVVGQFFKRTDLKWQAFALVVLASARALVVNFELKGEFHHLSYRLISVSLVALGIYLLARWAPLAQVRPIYSVAGTLLLVYLAFRESPAPWRAVYWVGLALVLCVAARLWKDRALLWQTHLVALLATGWTLYTNYDPQYRGTRLQWLTMGIVAAVLYALTWLSDIADVIENERISQAYAWAGSLLVSWLAWYQFPPNSVSLAWAIFALLLFEFPDVAGSLKLDVKRWAASWRAQAYVAVIGSFIHIFIANFNAGWGPAAYAVLPLPPIYFYLAWQVRGRELSRFETNVHVEFLLACLGTATLAALARFELPLDTVVIGYAGLVVATLLVAWLAQQQTFLFQALVLLGVTAFRLSLHNFYRLRDPFGSSLSGAIWALALLACAVPVALQVRKNAATANVPRWFRMFAQHPEQPMFFVPVVLFVVLLYLKVSGWKLTGEWAAAGLVIWVLALWARERSFRLTGLALVLVLSLGKVAVWDIWHLGSTPRIIAVGGVGLILILLSFLYSKYGQAIREYL